MNKAPIPAAAHAADIDAMAAALAGTAERLHGIVSRTDRMRIAAEVLRLNDAVRIAVEPHPDAPSVRLEMWGASRKKALLESVVGRQVLIVAPDGSVIESSDDEGE